MWSYLKRVGRELTRKEMMNILFISVGFVRFPVFLVQLRWPLHNLSFALSCFIPLFSSHQEFAGGVLPERALGDRPFPGGPHRRHRAVLPTGRGGGHGPRNHHRTGAHDRTSGRGGQMTAVFFPLFKTSFKKKKKKTDRKT